MYLDRVKTTKGVVTKVDLTTIRISCCLPYGGGTMVEVPKEWVPEYLRYFGAAIWLGIDQNNKIEIVERKEVERSPVPEDIRKWLEEE